MQREKDIQTENFLNEIYESQKGIKDFDNILFGEVMWELLIKNDIKKEGIEYSIHSWRGTGGVIADFLNEKFGYKLGYLDFYMCDTDYSILETLKEVKEDRKKGVMKKIEKNKMFTFKSMYETYFEMEEKEFQKTYNKLKKLVDTKNQLKINIEKFLKKNKFEIILRYTENM